MYQGNIAIAKLCEVKHPIVATQKSIGADFFLPQGTKEFFDLISKVNNANYIQTPDSELVNFFDGNGVLICAFNVLNNTLCVHKFMKVPTGIMMDIPEDFFMDVRPKSSGADNGYHVILGTVDEDYTYGIAVQVEPMYGSFDIVVDQKFAQLVFIKKEVNNISFVQYKINDFESRVSVQTKRGFRKGGFGSTTKF